jgi:hypothetical protein
MLWRSHEDHRDLRAWADTTDLYFHPEVRYVVTATSRHSHKSAVRQCRCFTGDAVLRARTVIAKHHAPAATFTSIPAGKNMTRTKIKFTHPTGPSVHLRWPKRRIAVASGVESP